MDQRSETPAGFSGSPSMGYRRDSSPYDSPRLTLAEIEAMAEPLRAPAGWVEPARQPRDKRSAPIPPHVVDRAAGEAAFDPATAGLDKIEGTDAVVAAFLDCVQALDTLQRPADRARVARALAAFF